MKNMSVILLYFIHTEGLNDGKCNKEISKMPKVLQCLVSVNMWLKRVQQV